MPTCSLTVAFRDQSIMPTCSLTMRYAALGSLLSVALGSLLSVISCLTWAAVVVELARFVLCFLRTGLIDAC